MRGTIFVLLYWWARRLCPQRVHPVPLACVLSPCASFGFQWCTWRCRLLSVASRLSWAVDILVSLPSQAGRGMALELVCVYVLFLSEPLMFQLVFWLYV